ncbi:MAG TPA: PilZ domain-containing protein [Candidatus Manganitrophaceae bacterium]|nr:PilZ domain-containing protein [Candidatus Manganitrophaceae bacterium]
MSKETGRERRVNERYDLTAKVTYEPSAALMLKEESRDGRTVNISKGGFCIKVETPLTASQIIRVRLPVSDVDAAPPTLAEVRWIEDLKGEKGYWVGLRFLL